MLNKIADYLAVWGVAEIFETLGPLISVSGSIKCDGEKLTVTIIVLGVINPKDRKPGNIRRFIIDIKSLGKKSGVKEVLVRGLTPKEKLKEFIFGPLRKFEPKITIVDDDTAFTSIIFPVDK